MFTLYSDALSLESPLATCYITTEYIIHVTGYILI